MAPEIKQAVEMLRSGGLVAFPTETVYGLGADATNADAVAKIFVAKGRPSTNPLIVHVAGAAAAKLCARRWPDSARVLGATFWPGPLTLVLPRGKTIAPAVSAGRDTVGIRVPDHPVAIALLHAFNGPVAAPSANRSNHVSPTTASHVREEFGRAVKMILDGGSCRVGIESTVLDLTPKVPVILRPGAIRRDQIEALIGPITTAAELGESVVSHEVSAASPGQHAVHYAPHTPAYRFDDSESSPLPTGKFGLMSLSITRFAKSAERQIRMPHDPAGYAHALYGALRELDALGLSGIYVQLPPDEPEWQAVIDRLTRATRPIGER